MSNATELAGKCTAADADKPYADAYYAAVTAKDAANFARLQAWPSAHKNRGYSEYRDLEAKYLEAYDAVKTARTQRELNMATVLRILRERAN